jgi:hypothetical protein
MQGGFGKTVGAVVRLNGFPLRDARKSGLLRA